MLTDFPVTVMASQLTLVQEKLWQETTVGQIFCETVGSMDDIPMIDYSRKLQQWVREFITFSDIRRLSPRCYYLRRTSMFTQKPSLFLSNCARFGLTLKLLTASRSC